MGVSSPEFGLRELKVAFELACRDLGLSEADIGRRQRLAEMIRDLAVYEAPDGLLLKRMAVERFHRLAR